MKDTLDFFRALEVDESWTYPNLTSKDTTYLTHSYHRYPAKFIPQLVRRIMNQYSKKEELVCDPFVGSGTTLLEALLIQRHALGVDINLVAYLITKAKTTCIEPQLLKAHITRFFAELNCRKDKACNNIIERVRKSPNYKRIRFWFEDRAIHDLSFILSLIKEVHERSVQYFLKCGFSQILKDCSRWNMNSLKPVRDKDKNTPNVIPIFERHIKHMVKKNKEYYQTLPRKVREDISNYIEILCRDCRSIPCEDGCVSLIVTSPPYVTSYEYADLHQLTLLWLDPETDITETRKNHIGTAQPKEAGIEEIRSELANEISRRLRNKASEVDGSKSHYLSRCAEAVSTYFAEMQQALEEFLRVLRSGGIACIVIGNTTLGSKEILNAEALSEIAMNVGFKLLKAIKRRIPSNRKCLPSTRDPETGQFVSEKTANKRLVYPHEYIVVLERN